MLCSRPDVEFWQHLPAVLLIHISTTSREVVYPENNREALTKFRVGLGPEHGKTNPIYTYSGCKWITLYNRKNYYYKHANECIFITVTLSNGRRILVTRLT